MPLKIYVASRSDNLNKATSSPYPLNVKLSSSSPTLLELKTQVSQQIKPLKVERQRVTTQDKKPLLNDDAKLNELGLKDGDTVWVKDLGPQVSSKARTGWGRWKSRQALGNSDTGRSCFCAFG